MLQHDPSEGVHASQILPLTYQYFDVIDRRDYGGSIMRPFFTGILAEFRLGGSEGPDDRAADRADGADADGKRGVVPNYQTVNGGAPPAGAAGEADGGGG